MLESEDNIVGNQIAQSLKWLIKIYVHCSKNY